MKCISYSLWGDNKVYTYGMVENVLLAPEVYPGWRVRIHYNSTVPSHIIDWFKTQEHVDVVFHEGTTKKASNTLWRFEDLFTDWTVIVRDSDSRLNIREKAAVDEWLASSKDFHIMRDHMHHTVPIMAGAFGCRNNGCKYMTRPNNSNNFNMCPVNFGLTREIFDLFVNGINDGNDRYMIDQIFLYQFVYPNVVLHSMIHTSHNPYEPFAKEFPDTDYSGFVGEIITDTPNASKIFGDIETTFERVGQY